MARRPPIPRPIGTWTASKLEHLSAYLKAFALATKSAQERYYIDTMAGCGECVMKPTGVPTLGSAWRALNVSPQFTGIHLIELDTSSASYLRSRTAAHSTVRVYTGDCNEVIPNEVLPGLSTIAPTLAFIDPTAVQVKWKLLEQLAAHRRGTKGRKLELLILFPFDMFINRWMSQRRLWHLMDAFYGSLDWQRELERSTELKEGVDQRRERFLRLYLTQLTTALGYKHALPFGPLAYRKRRLYHMVFATDDDAGARIMSDVWKKDRPIAGQLFYDAEFPIHPEGWPPD